MNKYKRLITTAFNEVYLANNPTIKQSQELAHKFIQDIIQKARSDFGSEIDEFITQRDKSHKAIMSTTQQEVSSFLSASLVGLPFEYANKNYEIQATYKFASDNTHIYSSTNTTSNFYLFAGGSQVLSWTTFGDLPFTG